MIVKFGTIKGFLTLPGKSSFSGAVGRKFRLELGLRGWKE